MPLKRRKLCKPRHNHPLALARYEQGITQRELAEQLGCSHSTIGNVERGRSSALGLKKYAQIAHLWNIPLVRLLAEDHPYRVSLLAIGKEKL